MKRHALFSLKIKVKKISVVCCDFCLAILVAGCHDITYSDNPLLER